MDKDIIYPSMYSDELYDDIVNEDPMVKNLLRELKSHFDMQVVEKIEMYKEQWTNKPSYKFSSKKLIGMFDKYSHSTPDIYGYVMTGSGMPECIAYKNFVAGFGELYNVHTREAIQERGATGYHMKTVSSKKLPYVIKKLKDSKRFLTRNSGSGPRVECDDARYWAKPSLLESMIRADGHEAKELQQRMEWLARDTLSKISTPRTILKILLDGHTPIDSKSREIITQALDSIEKLEHSNKTCLEKKEVIMSKPITYINATPYDGFVIGKVQRSKSDKDEYEIVKQFKLYKNLQDYDDYEKIIPRLMMYKIQQDSNTEINSQYTYKEYFNTKLSKYFEEDLGIFYIGNYISGSDTSPFEGHTIAITEE